MLKRVEELKNEIKKVVVGQDKMVDSILIGLFSDGHILLEGLPGLAKTTTINTIAKTLGLEFKRAQFTPDLLPSDIIGAEIYNMQNSSFNIKKGPIFTNLLLADEINRAPAKVQSALLEVMQERQITISSSSFKLEPPFLVMATQNPIEQEGAYRLPEAQLDRFMLNIIVNYNTKDEEREIIQKAINSEKIEINQILSKDDLIKIKKDIENIHIDNELIDYILNIIFASREPNSYGLDEIASYIKFGASPRASIDLTKASKVLAYLKDKKYVTPLDIATIAKDVLRHRIILSYEAQANEITTDYIVDTIISKIDIP